MPVNPGTLSRRRFLVGAAQITIVASIHLPLSRLSLFASPEAWLIDVTPVMNDDSFAVEVAYDIPATVILPVDIAVFSQPDNFLVWQESLASHSGSVEIDLGFGGIAPGGEYDVTILATDADEGDPPLVPFTAMLYPGADSPDSVFLPIVLR
jgi:hypothetical protein